jgi:cation diffusion facilitator CzcD-associated flavoprotein CzcO
MNSNFKGHIVHTADWNHSLDLAGKAVAVVGTGASAVQVIPSIADKVRRLEIFQRNAPWTVTRGQVTFPTIAKAIFRYVPFVMRAYRCMIFWTNEFLLSSFRVGTLFSKLGPLDHHFSLWRHIKDSSLKKLLTPTSAVVSKLVKKTHDLLPALAKPNVCVHTSEIEKIVEDGLLTANGQHVPVDIIVLATGFKVHDYFAPMKIIARNGLDLLELWLKESPKGYYGICANKVPNNFVIIGPGTVSNGSANILD